MNLIEACVRNPIKVAVGVILIGMFGILALFRMPMQLTPEVQTPTLTIETRWPGATPYEIEREIVQEQEEQLKAVEGVTKMSSECMDSMGRITLEFAVGTNMEESLLKVNSRLQQVPEYPEDADQPVIQTANASDRPIAWFILSAKTPTAADFDAFVKKHPQLADAVEPARKSHTSGLKLLRLRTAAKKHPEVNELISPVDVSTLRRYAEDVIEAQFERVQGVSAANVIGGLEDELQVIIDPQRLAARQLTIADVRNVLRGQNMDTSAGDFWEGKRRYVVRTLGQFRSPADVERQLLAMRDGVPVYVRDVAEVKEGFKKPDGLVRRFGSTSIAINALRETGANVLDVMDGLQQAQKDLNEGPLAERGVELTQAYDETEYIHSAVGMVNSNIVTGGILTAAALLIFLRSVRSTLVIGLAIPTSFIGTFLLMNALGRSLNVISLAGLAFAVGMLVDNAIVVLENIFRHYTDLKRSPIRAAVDGTSEVWGAVAASTFTNLAVFIPVLLIQEEAGQLFRDIALAISGALALSLIVSVLVVPTTASWVFKQNPTPSTPPAGHATNGSHAANGHGHSNGHAVRIDGVPSAEAPSPPPPRWYSALLKKFLLPFDLFGRAFVATVVGINRFIQSHTLIRIGAVAGMMILSVYFSWLLWPKVEYLPTGNRNLTFGIVLPPPGYNLDQLMVLGETVERELQPYWDVDPDSPETKKLDHPIIGDFFYVARGRQVFVGLRALDPTEAGKLVPLMQSVRPKLPGTFVVAKQSSLFEQGLTAGRTIDIEITGPDLPGKLIPLGGQVLGQVTQIIPNAQVRPVPSLDYSSPEVHVHPKLVQGSDLGISATDLGYTVNALVDGAYATDYFIGGDKIDLTIKGQEKYATRTQDLQSLPIATPLGQLIPLGSLADVELSSGPEQINHRERLRAITIEVSPPEGMALQDAIEKVQKEIIEPMRASGALKGGYAINLSGTADKLSETWNALKWNVILALLITYLLMAALFESWLHPFVIILSVPLGAIGGIIGLRLLSVYLGWWGQPPQSLDVLTMLGFVILVGTVVNNPILIVHQAINHMRDDGMELFDAVIESTRTRIRPIFMTTVTTIVGLVPLVLAPGAGSELYRGLGAVLLGGLVISTIFTLFLVPPLFTLSMDAKNFMIWLFYGSPPAQPVPEAVTLPSPTHAPHTEKVPMAVSLRD